MEVQINKGMRLYLFTIKVFFVIIVIANLVFSVYNEKLFHPSIFGIFDICMWFYGVLCAHGYFRKVTSEIDENGQVISETFVPYVQVIIGRIVQCAFSVIGAMTTTNFRVLLILIGLDAVYIIILLVYKASYYYISLPYNDTEE